MNIHTSTTHTLRPFLRFHYRAGPPGPVVHTLAALDGRHTVGVLAISMPTLNALGRSAFPMPTGSASSRAQWLNTNLRTISRVIVEPRHRGQGIASALIRHYLAQPLTRFTEAFASMGHVSPLFEAAGMVRCPTPPLARDQRLIRVLDRLAIDIDALIDADATAQLLTLHPDLATALASWANDSKATRALRNTPLSIAPRAAQRLLFPPCVYHAPNGQPV